MSLDLLPAAMPTEDRDQIEISEYVASRYNESRKWDEPFKEQCRDSWKAVNSKLPANWPYFWGIFAPETAVACNDTIENIMSTVFPKDAFFDLRACTGQTEVQTEIMREAEKFALRRASYKERYFFWELDNIIYGNGVLATFAEPSFRKVTVEEPILDPYGYGATIGSQRVQKMDVKVWPELKNISRWNVFPFPGPVEGGDLQRAPYFIIRRFMPLEAVRSMARKPWAMWRNTEKLQGLYSINGTTGAIASNTSDLTEFEDIWKLLQLIGLDITSIDSSGSNTVKWCEVLYYYEAPPGERGCRAYAILCENKVLACRGNEYDHAMKPLADIKWQPYHTDLWNCYGVAQGIKAYQEIINIRMAQRFEQVELFLRPPRLVGAAAGKFPLTWLNPWPNAHSNIPGDVNAIRTLDFPNVKFDMMQDDQDAKIGIQRATRISNVSKGIADPALGEGATKTARGIAFLTDATNRAAAFKQLLHEQIGVVPQLTQTAQILQQVMDDGTIIHITDVNETLKRAGLRGDRLPVNREDIAGEWEFYAIGSSKTQEPNVVANNMREFWMPILQDPEHGSKFDRMEIYKDSHELIFGRPITKYLKTDQDMQRVLAQLKPPVPKEMIPRFNELDVQAKDVVKDRLGLPATGVTAQDEEKTADTVSNVIKEATRQPKDLSVRQ